MVTLEELENYILGRGRPAPHGRASPAMTYVSSLKQILERGDKLTFKQEKAFRAIAKEKLTADQRYELWKEAFTPKMKEKTRVMTSYYIEILHENKLSPYERQNILPIAETAGREPNYVPSRKHYELLCQGSTAKKILRQHYADPKFACGELVVAKAIGRKSIPRSFNILSRGGYVIQTNAMPVSSTTKGSKWYSVLPIGSTKPCFIQERWLKKGKPY